MAGQTLDLGFSLIRVSSEKGRVFLGKELVKGGGIGNVIIKRRFAERSGRGDETRGGERQEFHSTGGSEIDAIPFIYESR